MDELLGELQTLQDAREGSRRFDEVVLDVIVALVEASQLQTQQVAQLLDGLKRQTNAFGQLRKALDMERYTNE